jgi:hypothetical protein
VIPHAYWGVRPTLYQSTSFAGLRLSLQRAVSTRESGEDMTVQGLQLELDQKAAGQVLESVAERLLRLEKVREDEVDEDTFADAKNDALALRPLYTELCRRAVETYGREIMTVSSAIAELETIYNETR